MPATRSRAPVAVRRLGYLIAAGLGAVAYVVLNVAPGWQAVPFLTAQTDRVLWLVNVSLIAGIVLNLGYAVYDPHWLRGLGDLLTTSIGLVVLLRVWRVFPFDFEAFSFPWASVTRIVLAVAVVGSAIGIVVQFVMLARMAIEGAPDADGRGAVPR